MHEKGFGGEQQVLFPFARGCIEFPVPTFAVRCLAKHMAMSTTSQVIELLSSWLCVGHLGFDQHRDHGPCRQAKFTMSGHPQKRSD